LTKDYLRLVSSGKFIVGEAYQIIQDMAKAGCIEEISFDTYRRAIGTNNMYNTEEKCSSEGNE
jgi:hypothetical protein